jgi:hypothetical protein
MKPYNPAISGKNANLPNDLELLVMLKIPFLSPLIGSAGY